MASFSQQARTGSVVGGGRRTNHRVWGRMQIMAVPWFAGEWFPRGPKSLRRNKDTFAASRTSDRASLPPELFPRRPTRQGLHRFRSPVAHGATADDGKDSRSRNTAPCEFPAAERAAGIAAGTPWLAGSPFAIVASCDSDNGTSPGHLRCGPIGYWQRPPGGRTARGTVAPFRSPGPPAGGQSELSPDTLSPGAATQRADRLDGLLQLGRVLFGMLGVLVDDVDHHAKAAADRAVSASSPRRPTHQASATR